MTRIGSRAHLHWFWRGAIATTFGAACMVAFVWLLDGTGIQYRLSVWFERFVHSRFASRTMVVFLYGLITTFAGLAAYALLTCRHAPVVPDGEIHCRRCNHILRGLSEPRCPECGETI